MALSTALRPCGGRGSDFRHLLQRELIDGDESRLRLAAEHVFQGALRGHFGIVTRPGPELVIHTCWRSHGRAHPVSLRDCAGAPIPAGVREDMTPRHDLRAREAVASRALLLTK